MKDLPFVIGMTVFFILIWASYGMRYYSIDGWGRLLGLGVVICVLFLLFGGK